MNMKLSLNPYQNYLEVKSQLFLEGLKDCEKKQSELLNQIIKTNQNSKFGKKYNFKEISPNRTNQKQSEYFIKLVPKTNYEILGKYIESEKNKKNSNTIISEVVDYFAITSGTTNTPKFLPHTKASIKKRKISWEVWNHSIFNERPKTYSLTGSILAFTSKSFDGFTKSHIKYGSVSGRIHDMQPIFVKQLFATPDEIAQVDDFKLKYYLNALFSVRENLTFIATPNPSTILIYVKSLIENIDQIIEDLETNNIKFLEKINTENKNNKSGMNMELKEQLFQSFTKNKKLNLKTAQRLKQLKLNNQISPKYIFPNLQTIGCWTKGHVNIYLKELKSHFADTVMIRELGYMASEGRFSIPLKTTNNGEGVLDIETNFYEFIKVEDYETQNEKSYLAHQVKPGQKYYMLITNENGLYRYDLNDIIEVTGFYEDSKTPLITFVQKGKYFSSITGEKISEWEINKTIEVLQEKEKIHIKTFFVLPKMSAKSSNYNYYIEFAKKQTKTQIKKFEETLEKELRKENIEYKEKRDSLRLNPIKIIELPKHSVEKIKLAFKSKKANDSQIKEPKLIVLDKDIKTINKFIKDYKL